MFVSWENVWVGAARVAMHLVEILIDTNLDICHGLGPDLLVGVRNV